MAIGGLKEKVLAAHRSGVKTILLPKENTKDLRDIPKRVRRAIKFIPVEHMDEVLKEALVLEDPDAFLNALKQPLIMPDVHIGATDFDSDHNPDEEDEEDGDVIRAPAPGTEKQPPPTH